MNPWLFEAGYSVYVGCNNRFAAARSSVNLNQSREKYRQ
jgi:hypothetical protein